MELSCTIHEFAQRSGVTVRALRHYDRLGLLSPGRSPSGYRRYSKSDAGRLQRIQALQWAGFGLKEIGRLLNDGSSNVADALNRQRDQLEERRRRLDLAITAIRQADLITKREQIFQVIGLNRAMATLTPDPQLAGRIAEKCREWKKSFTESFSSEEIDHMKKESADLFRDAEAAAGEDPAGPAGQSIAARYRQIMAKQCRGNPDLLASALDLHRKIPVFPAGLELESKLQDFSNTAWVFLEKALAAKRQSQESLRFFLPTKQKT